MKMSPQDKRKMLNFDSLAEAEKATGESYKKDEHTQHFGFLLHLGKTATVKAVLEEDDDTTFATKVVDYLRIAKELGFEIVLEHDFIIPEELKKSYDDGKIDRHYIMWHPEYSVLLNFDTYGGNETVNGGNFYYAWKPKNMKNWHDYTSSGGFKPGDIWVGSHDCREALRFNFEELRDNGQFLKQWTEQPHLWLMHYGDQRIAKELEDDHSALYGPGGKWDKINKGYLDKLPAHVQKAICYQGTIDL